MVRNISLSLSPEDGFDESRLRVSICRSLRIQSSSVTGIRIRKRSIDARHRSVKVLVEADVYIGETPEKLYKETVFPFSDAKKRAVVVGFGPAGIFASLTLLENGVTPIVLERGKDVHSRLKDTAILSREGKLYAFGEGGAGAFSDGKLYTRSTKRGDAKRILSLLVQHGADESILYDARPHIGSDRLPYIIENIRKTIEAHGGEIHFGKKVTGLIQKNDERTQMGMFQV